MRSSRSSAGSGGDGRWRVIPRFSLQILSGIESACWDALGKGLGVPASTFLGGRVHDEVDFMAFPQGDTAEELARDAPRLPPRATASSTSRWAARSATTRRSWAPCATRSGRSRSCASTRTRPGTCRARSTRSGASRSSTWTGSSSRCPPGTSPASPGCAAPSRRRSPPTRPCTRPPSSAPSSSTRRPTRSCSAATSRAASGGGGSWPTSPSRTGSR